MPGRGEPIRLLLKHAGVNDFVDHRVKMPDWPALKNTFELKQMPVLIYYGKKLAQSYATLQFLGKTYGFMPSSPEENYLMISIMNTMEDLFNSIMKAMSPFSPYDDAKKKELSKDLEEKVVPLLLGELENRLKNKHNKDFIVGESLTVADFYIMGLYTQFTTIPPAKQIIDKFQGCPLLKAYLEKRLKSVQPTLPPAVKVYDLDTTYKGELIRTALKAAKMPFEDVRIKREDWPAKKDSFPLKQLPVLEVAGKKKNQTNSIMHSICLRRGYLPLEPCKYASVLEMCGMVDDLAMGFGMAMMPMLSEETRKKKLQDYTIRTVPLIFLALETRLKKNKSQEFFVGRKYSMIDFYLIAAAKTMILSPANAKNFEEALKARPVLKAYFEKRLIDFP